MLDLANDLTASELIGIVEKYVDLGKAPVIALETFSIPAYTLVHWKTDSNTHDCTIFDTKHNAYIADIKQYIEVPKNTNRLVLKTEGTQVTWWYSGIASL